MMKTIQEEKCGARNNNFSYHILKNDSQVGTFVMHMMPELLIKADFQETINSPSGRRNQIQSYSSKTMTEAGVFYLSEAVLMLTSNGWTVTNNWLLNIGFYFGFKIFWHLADVWQPLAVAPCVCFVVENCKIHRTIFFNGF